MIVRECSFPHHLATRLLLLAAALVGVAHVLFLPPWEGFDEYAHWSSIQQIADTGAIPFYGKDHISADIDAYPGPMPYTSTPPFDNTGHPTYRSFDISDTLDLSNPVERTFRQGKELNWQAQHPPLYYLSLAPAYLSTKNFSWLSHLLALRLLSWGFAFSGLMLGVLAAERYIPADAKGIVPFMAAYPFLVPQFFPEMARLGNDSLCLLLMGVVWTLLLRIGSPNRQAWTAPALGLALGAGLLTKAFFVPISAGVTGYLAVCFLLERRRQKALDLLTCLSIAGLIGAAWYLRNLMLFDNVLGTNDFIRLAHGIGLSAGLEQNFSLTAFIRGFAAIFGTYVWAGTWSLAQPPEYVLLAPATLIILTVGIWGGGLRSSSVAKWPALLIPVFLVTPVIGGLGYHLLTAIAETGRGAGTPGWYLHILATPISFAMAIGWSKLKSFTVPRMLAAGSVAVGILGWILQLSLFSGCSVKAGTNKYYDLTGSGCWIDWNRLAAIGYPNSGLLFLSSGLFIGLVALGVWLSASTRSVWPATNT
jgi:hypothetical protein